MDGAQATEYTFGQFWSDASRAPRLRLRSCQFGAETGVESRDEDTRTSGVWRRENRIIASG